MATRKISPRTHASRRAISDSRMKARARFRRVCPRSARHAPDSERFRAKWTPVRVKKTRQNKRLEPGSDSIRADKASRVDRLGSGVLKQEFLSTTTCL